MHVGLWQGSALPHQRLEPNLKVLHVGRRTFIEEYEIEGELLHPQIFVRMKQLAGDVEVLGVGDAQQQDRQVAGNAQWPEPRLRAGASKDGVGGRPQGGS